MDCKWHVAHCHQIELDADHSSASLISPLSPQGPASAKLVDCLIHLLQPNTSDTDFLYNTPQDIALENQLHKQQGWGRLDGLMSRCRPSQHHFDLQK
jgi:hypothetical protein